MATRKTPTDMSEDAFNDARGGDKDTRDRMPSLTTVIRYMSPDAIAERRRKARENFGRVTPVPAGAEPVLDEAPHATDTPDAEPTSGPSPWAQAGVEIDKAALPSATMPARTSDPADPEPARDEKAAARGLHGRRHTWIIVAVCTVVAVVGPILMIIAGRTRRPVEEHGGVATASARPAAPATSPAPMSPSASVAPALTAVPSSAPTAAPAPSSVPAAVTARPAPAPERLSAPPVPKAAAAAADAGPPAPPPQPKPTNNGDPLLNE